jgi:hypothetical protein
MCQKDPLMNSQILTLSLTTIMLCFSSCLSAQVTGVAASKLGAYNAESIGARNFEFEPAFFLGYVARTWNTDRIVQPVYENTDTADLTLDAGFRFTYGIGSRLEAGCYLPMDLSSLSLASKFLFLASDKYDLSGILGINILGLGEARPRQMRSYEQSTLLAGGIAFSWQGNDKFSLDANAQVQKTLAPTFGDHRYDLFLTADAGYYIKPGIQFIAELNYSASNFYETSLSNDCLILNTGLTIETAENFIIVLNTPLPLLGKNTDIQYGLGFALTVMLE